MRTYRDLEVYKKSYEQAKAIYELAKRFPAEELYGLTSQIKRAATSIALNIAEGYGKGASGKELLRFLSMARGSSVEVEVLLEFCKDFGYITESQYCVRAVSQEEIGKMLTGLIRSVTNTNN